MCEVFNITPAAPAGLRQTRRDSEGHSRAYSERHTSPRLVRLRFIRTQPCRFGKIIRHTTPQANQAGFGRTQPCRFSIQ